MSLSEKLKVGTLNTSFETLYRLDIVSELLGWTKEHLNKFRPGKYCVVLHGIDYISFQGLLYVVPLYNFGTYKSEDWSKTLFPS
jgi:hypothetical protein